MSCLVLESSAVQSITRVSVCWWVFPLAGSNGAVEARSAAPAAQPPADAAATVATATLPDSAKSQGKDTVAQADAPTTASTASPAVTDKANEQPVVPSLDLQSIKDTSKAPLPDEAQSGQGQEDTEFPYITTLPENDAVRGRMHCK